MTEVGLERGIRVRRCDLMVKANSTRSRSHKRGSKCLAGMTITEVVVASGLLVIALVPTLRALGTATLTQTKIAWKTQSLALARGKLDEIRARCVHHYGDSFTQSSVVLDGAYLCNISDGGDTNLKLLTVAVGYDVDSNGSLSNDETEVTLATYIANCF